MTRSELTIKNMVCDRCKRVVREDLQAIGLKVLEIQLGRAVVTAIDGKVDNKLIMKVLEESGFELLVGSKARLITQVKSIIINLIYEGKLEFMTRNISDVISEETGKSYPYMSSLFSSVEGITIEKYIIVQKIERVKELLIYDELTLTEISYQLGYSSVQHLSNQFRKITGMSPRSFKVLHNQHSHRHPVDKAGDQYKHGHETP